MIDSFNRTLQLLLPVRMVLASSDSVNKRLTSKYSCSLGNVFQLFPQITDIAGSIRDPSSTTAYHLNSLNFSIHPLSCLAQEKLVTSSIKDQIGHSTNDREQNLFSVVEKVAVKDVTNLERENDNEVPQTPWFTEWKHHFLRTLCSCDHEYVDAFIGVIYVILIDEISSYKQIMLQLNETISSLNLKWFSSSFLRYFIILNLNATVSASDVASNEHYREFVSQYGSVNCFWYDILDDNDIIVALDETPSSVVEVSSLNVNLPSNSIHQPEGNGNGTVKSLNLNSSPSILADPLTSPESPEAIDFAMVNTFKNVKSEPFSNTQSNMSKSSSVSQSMSSYPSSLAVTKPVVSQGILLLTERCLRNLVESSLIPWSEKVMRLLNDAISARKGIRKSLKVFLGMAPGSSVVRGPTSFIYKIDSDEMQVRKLADLAFALGLYELAYKWYHSARDEFKADGACVYYAGAAEMTGITAFLTKRNNFKHYFDQSLATYLDTCKNRDLAARSVILATECIRAVSSNDAANYFIRLTCEEADLMSALFLEQAAICFLESLLPRKRKSAFHFVLAGHRYNKCGLRKHALSCYSRFSSSSWSAASDHVNITIARLLIALVDKNELSNCNESSESVWHKGLDLLRKHTDNELFFEDFVREVKRRGLLGNRFTLNVPHIVSLRMDPIEGSTLTQGKITCFRNEPVTFHVTLYSPFNINIRHFTLHTNVRTCEASVISSLDLDGEIEQTVTLTLVPRETGPLDILGVQFTAHPSDIKATVLLDEKRARKNQLLVIETLPLVTLDIKIGSYDVNVDAIEMLTGEYMPCNITLLLSPNSTFNSDWKPMSLKLLTNAQLLDVTSRQVIPVSLESPMLGIDLKFGSDGNLFYLQSPFGHQSHTVTFRIEYRDSRHSRTVTRRVEIYCRECIAIEGMTEGVVSLRNTLSAKAIQLTTDTNEDPLDLYPGLTAHVLVEENQLIPWRCSSRQGFLSLNNSTQQASLTTGF